MMENGMKNRASFETKISNLVAKTQVDLAKPKQRIGFLEGQFVVPDDFDTMFAQEIEEMFYGKYDGTDLYEVKS
jgi:hypothetical protein